MTVSDADFVPLSVTRDGIVRQLDHVAKTSNGEARKLVRAGDFAINSRSDRKGSAGLAREDGSVSVITTVLAVRDLEGRFVHYLLRSEPFQEEYYRFGTGIVADLWSTRWSSMKDIRIPLPGRREQLAIADFLDRETEEIGAFIRDQEELIGLLRERRAATISHAVTGGLQRGAQNDDQRIPWIGSIPLHWKVSPLARATSFREGPGIGLVDFRDEGVPLLRISGVRGRYASLYGCNFLDPAQVNARWSHFQVQLGELLVSASASMGTVSEAGSEVVGAVPYTGIIRFAPGPDLEKDFLRLFLESNTFMTQVDRLKTGSTMQHYGPEHLRQMSIALPPREEQRRLVTEVTERLADTDAAIDDAEKAAILSRERRSALISAAVTGKIDVREYVGV